MNILVNKRAVEPNQVSFPAMSLSSKKRQVLERGVSLLTVEYGFEEFVSLFKGDYATLAAELNEDLKFERPGKAEQAVLEARELSDFLEKPVKEINEVVQVYLWQSIMEKSFTGEGEQILWAVHGVPVVEVRPGQIILRVDAYKCL